MHTKTITYKRILNLGNYESKHLEETIELLETEDVDSATSQLMERVERKIREDVSDKIEREISKLTTELWKLKDEYRTLKKSVEELKPPEQEEEAPIPFDSGAASKDSSDSPEYINDGF